MVLEALGRAATDPAGVPLHGNKAAPGLFAATAPARQAARNCLDEEYLRVIRSETRGKSTVDICKVTEKGLAFLLSQSNPRQVLEELVRSLEARQNETGTLLATARQMQASLDALNLTAHTVF